MPTTETASDEYKKINKSNGKLDVPKSLTLKTDYIPEISKPDIDKQFIYRYFGRQANLEHGEIVEISEQTYSGLRKYSLYALLKMPWRISGPIHDVKGTPTIANPENMYTGVLTANKLSIDEAENEMPGIRMKLNNLLQYYTT